MEKKLVQNLLHKELSYKVHGAAIEVRKDFGPGHKEKLYQKAFEEELRRKEISFEREPAIKIHSPKDGKYVGLYRPDFIIDGKIIIELKAEKFVSQNEIKRIYDYLRNSEYELAYFVNFASPQLYVKRIIFTNDHKPFHSSLITTNTKPIDANKKPINTNVEKLLVAISLILVFFSGSAASAADMYFAAPRTSYGVGEEIQIALKISSPKEKINALEGTVVFPAELVDFAEVYDNNSMVTAWVEKPTLNGNRIHFSSIVVGGFDGLIDPFQPGNKKAGTVANFVFQAKKEGSGSFEIENSAVYLHDGKGTRGELATAPLSFIIGPAVTPAERKILDDRPPEPFEVLIDQSDLIFDNRYFAAFQAEDIGSGIAYYKIKEGGGRWLPAESPYPLHNQKLTGVIKIKAVDKAGNERVVTWLPVPHKDLSYLWYLLAALLLILLLHLFLDHRRKTVYNINVYERDIRSKK